MGRYLWLFVLFGIGLLLLRRSLGTGAPSRTPRIKRDAPQTLVCAKCDTRYDPEVSGWACPRCGK